MCNYWTELRKMKENLQAVFGDLVFAENALKSLTEEEKLFLVTEAAHRGFITIDDARKLMGLPPI